MGPSSAAEPKGRHERPASPYEWMHPLQWSCPPPLPPPCAPPAYPPAARQRPYLRRVRVRVTRRVPTASAVPSAGAAHGHSSLNRAKVRSKQSAGRVGCGFGGICAFHAEVAPATMLAAGAHWQSMAENRTAGADSAAAARARVRPACSLCTECRNALTLDQGLVHYGILYVDCMLQGCTLCECHELFGHRSVGRTAHELPGTELRRRQRPVHGRCR